MPFDLGSFLLNPWMLLGLPVLAIPPVIHLLNRRRYQVVDWGAMQFLQVSEVTRRRLLIEELLLMFLRVALLALLVFALAGPYLAGPTAGRAAARVNRDVVLVFDGSYSMGSTSTGKSPHDAAREWALAFVNDLLPGDSVAVLQAKQQVVPVLGELSHDLDRVRERITKVPPPAGGCDWPSAVKAAHDLLRASQRAEREIILLGDGQRFGWADKDTLFRWDLLAGALGHGRPESPGSRPRPRLWAVNLAPERKARTPNWALAPLRGNRPVVPVGREATFRTDFDLFGQAGYAPPHRVRLEVDGKWVRDLTAPRSAQLQNGKVPFSFAHRFATAGSHLVTVCVEPDPPAGERPPGYTIKDHVPGDNRQDFAVEVIKAIPVLIVDGDPSPTAQRRGSDFLRDALSPAGDRAPVVRARVVPADEFGPALLAGAEGPENDPAARPRVLILCNVARLTQAQQEAVAQFLAGDGGVLVTLGNRVDATAYNDQLYRGGNGWLPARLDEVVGDETRFRDAPRPAPESFNHPALELFRQGGPGSLGEARFPRWWKVTTPGRHSSVVTAALLRSATEEYPFLVERVDRDSPGRVLLCPVPLDSSWGTNLPDLPAFVPLAHELVYYLAGARSAELNLQAGQPLRYRVAADASLQGFVLQPPVGEARPLGASADDPAIYPAEVKYGPQGAILHYEGTRETGVYHLQTPDDRAVYYVVQRDARESDLAPCTDEDRAAVSRAVPVRYQDDRAAILHAAAPGQHRQELWWWLLLGLVALLCGEVWMTRRIVKNR